MNLRPIGIVVVLWISMTSALYMGPSEAKRQRHEVNAPGKREKLMTKDAFQQAMTSFRKEIARQYEQPEETLEIIPADEKFVGFPAYKTDSFIPFQASFADKQVSGWANSQHEVVLYVNQSVGLLLRAAGLLDPAHSLSPLALAERIVCMLGGSHQLIKDPAGYHRPDLKEQPTLTPVVERHPDGSATLTFFVAKPDRNGTVQMLKVAAHCDANYQASLSLNPV